MASLPSSASKLEEILSLEQKIKVFSLKMGARGAVYLYISLDDKELWVNGIFENSRHSIFSISDNKIEQLSRYFVLPKFRKCNYKSMEEAGNKIIAWVNKI